MSDIKSYEQKQLEDIAMDRDPCDDITDDKYLDLQFCPHFNGERKAYALGRLVGRKLERAGRRIDPNDSHD